MRNDFAVFILTHGRPDNVLTYDSIRSHGYTGRIVILIDDTDKTAAQYQEKYGEQVYIFDKAAAAQTFDTADNSDDMRTIVYARNACFEVAKKLGIRYFAQFDDDYHFFRFRFTHRYEFSTVGPKIPDLDRVFKTLLAFLQSTSVASICMAQGGDFIGGPGGSFGKAVQLRRKAMNSFICDASKPIGFVGRINEDVNTYTWRASTGMLLFTANQVSLEQVTTQAAAGGMSDVYHASGTYIKSFYSVIFHPSSVTIAMMGEKHRRLHHRVQWRRTTPMILHEKYRR